MKLFHQSLIQLPQCILDESNYTHIYKTPDGERLRSVTTMINKTKSEESKKQLADWRDRTGHAVADYIMKTSMIIGTQTHQLNENYLNMERDNEEYLLLAQAHHTNFIPYINKITDVYAVEPKLFSNKMKLAGTADWVGMYDGKLTIGDYKTKRSQQKESWMTDYFIQTTAYARMWKELTDQDIEQLVIMVSSEHDTIQEFVSVPGLYHNMLDERLMKFTN